MFDIAQRIVEDLEVLSEGASAYFGGDALDDYHTLVSEVSNFVSSDLKGASLTTHEISRLVLDYSYDVMNLIARKRAEMEAVDNISKVLSYYCDLFKNVEKK